jgi:menaquinone-dependent protoporphyrinogen oxidase
MKPVLILYATRHGHTRKIAEHLQSTLAADRYGADVVNATDVHKDLQLHDYSAIILCASLHIGRYESEMTAFVKHRLAELQPIPAMFVSVSLVERSVEDPASSSEKRAQAAAAVSGTIDRFLNQTGWKPARIVSVAGALPYTKYDFVTRFILKRISAREGGPVDTSRDYELRTGRRWMTRRGPSWQSSRRPRLQRSDRSRFGPESDRPGYGLIRREREQVGTNANQHVSRFLIACGLLERLAQQR